MYKIVSTKRFLKSLRTIAKSGAFNRSKISSLIDILSEGKKLASNFKDHNLKGDMRDCRECHIENDLLLLYKQDKEDKIIILIDIGSHSDIFG